jgi:hypothetical protein
MFTTDLTTGLDAKPYTEVTIDKFGVVAIEGKNFKGATCSTMGEALRRAVGGGARDTSEPKPEMYETGNVTQGVTGW